MQILHEVLVISGYVFLVLLAIAILAFLCFIIILKVEGEPEDTDGDVDDELIKRIQDQIREEKDHQIF